MLDVSDIYLIQMVAELGSINKAADKLYMSQPTLSKRISRLEKTLNIELFHRHNTGMKATPVAHYLIDNGQQVQARLNAMCRHVERLSNLEGGSLNVGLGPVIEQLYFPDVLLDFINQTNKVQLSLKVESSSVLLSMIQDGHLDIAIGPFVYDEIPKELVISPVQSAPIIFVARPQHPILQTDTIHPLSALRDYSIIAPSISAGLSKFFDLEDLNPLLQISCDNYNISKSIAKSSDYITGGPASLFSNELAAGELVKISTQIEIPWTSYCISKPEALHTPTVKKFIDIFNQHIKQ